MNAVLYKARSHDALPRRRCSRSCGSS